MLKQVWQASKIKYYLELCQVFFCELSSVGRYRDIVVEFSQAMLTHLRPVLSQILLPKIKLMTHTKNIQCSVN